MSVVVRGLRWLQVLVFACAVLLSTWVTMPWPGVASLVLLCMVVAASGVVPANLFKGGNWLIIISWVCTAGILVSLLLTWPFTVDSYYGSLAWLVAGGVSMGVHGRKDEQARRRLKTLAMAWAFLGCSAWIAGSYWQDARGPFYIGLVTLLGMLIVWQVVFRMGGFVRQTINTLILIVIGLPLVDLFYQSSDVLDSRVETGEKWYSYAVAKRDPAAFGRWWRYYREQWEVMANAVFTADPEKVLPFRLKPGSRGFLFQSPISINKLGFRGPDCAREKGDAYRIVVIGESTTYGCTLRPEDRPWPEVLEEIIRERVACSRRVEVINAGVPAYTLNDSIHRLLEDVLPLKPDLVISYHGVNGFRLLDNALPTLAGKVSLAYRERPLKLLADCEYRLKILCYRWSQAARVRIRQPSLERVMSSQYANAYRDLIKIAQTNGLRLVLANFSMAVNSRSEPGPVEFYGSAFPGVEWHIKANEAHSQIVQQLARENPQCVFVDTHPGLDGAYEKFIDLVHFTQEGRQQMAENIFAGLREVLEADLHAGIPGRD